MFSNDQKIWIVPNYRKEGGFQKLRRDVTTHFKLMNKKTIIWTYTFTHTGQERENEETLIQFLKLH